MITTVERVSILETKVDDIRQDIKELHDCLDRTRDELMAELDKMHQEQKEDNRCLIRQLEGFHKENSRQHQELDTKILHLENFKIKWLTTIAVLGPIVAYIFAIIDWPSLLNNALK